jgi:hypothetical protein
MARVDDIVYSYLNLSRFEGMTDEAKKVIEEAIRYGFQQGESFGKYAYAEEVQKEVIREVFQENETKKLQKVVRTAYEVQPIELENALNEGWTVEHVNPIGGGYTLEYILEKTENLGNSETVKNPEE